MGINERWSGCAIVVKRSNGAEKILMLDSHHPKEESTHTKGILETLEQEQHPGMSFRLINVTVDIKEV